MVYFIWYLLFGMLVIATLDYVDSYNHINNDLAYEKFYVYWAIKLFSSMIWPFVIISLLFFGYDERLLTTKNKND